MSIFFWGHQHSFVFPIHTRKYRKYAIDRWIVVYTVCASAVISPLRQWLDSYATIRLKMCHTFKHFIHMHYFLLLTNLVIAFVHWVNIDVLYTPRQCSLFCDYIPESKLCFGVNLCRPSDPYSIRPIQKFLNCQTTTRGGFCSSHPDGEQPKQRCGSEFPKWHNIYTPEECADEWRQNNADLKLLENGVMNGFIMFGIMFMTATGLENSPQSFDAYTISQSRCVVTSAENPAPENSPQSTGELRNGHVANLQYLLYQTGSKNGVTYNSDACVNCVVP